MCFIAVILHSCCNAVYCIREHGISDSFHVCQPKSHLTVLLCFCATIINTHSGQSASASQSRQRALIFQDLCLLLKQKHKQAARHTILDRIRSWKSTDLLNICTADARLSWEYPIRKSADGESDALFKMQIVFLFM